MSQRLVEIKKVISDNHDENNVNKKKKLFIFKNLFKKLSIFSLISLHFSWMLW